MSPSRRQQQQQQQQQRYGRYRDNEDDLYHDESKEEVINATEEDAIRLKAFALLSRIGPDEDDDETTWPQKPEPILHVKSYQNSHHHQQHCPLEPAVVASRSSSYNNDNSSSNSYYKEFGLAGLLVSCIADACQKSTDYVARSGYETIYPTAATTTKTTTLSRVDDARGEFEKVSILHTYRSSHGQVSGES